MPRAVRISLLLLLLLMVMIGAFELPAMLHQLRLFEPDAQREEQARREVIRAGAGVAGSKKEKVAIFWLSTENPRELQAVDTPLDLAADPAQRARVALETLITGAPSPAARVLPLDASLLAFYLLPDGTAIADFSDAVSREIPSGISSEQLAVDAIVRTLHAAVPQARRVKILIAGQQVETLAGHVDLSGALDLGALPAPPSIGPQQATGGSTAVPANATAAPEAPSKITAPAAAPVKPPPAAEKTAHPSQPRTGSLR
jgi:Sporulation and spore germination